MKAEVECGNKDCDNGGKVLVVQLPVWGPSFRADHEAEMDPFYVMPPAVICSCGMMPMIRVVAIPPAGMVI